MGNKATGNAVIGQSGGPTCVINQSLVGAIIEAGKHSEIQKFYGALHGIKGLLDENFIDLGVQDSAVLEKVAHTPSAALGSVRKKPTEEECEIIFAIFKKNNIRYFFYIGGNDSAETANIINQLALKSGYDLTSFHIPKTIDNDLLVTDHCPGYGSAAKFVAMAIMGDNLDNGAIPGIKVNVVMGRHAGFLTAASALGRQHENDGPHLIYVPEIPFSKKKFIQDVKDVYNKLGRCQIAVSEGISDEEGNPIFQSGVKDAHGNVQLSGSGGLGDMLIDIIKQNIPGKLRARADTFGYLQRCFPGIVSEVDAEEARRVGEFAVKNAVETNLKNGSVAIKATGLFITPLHSVAKNTRSMPRDYMNEKGNNVTEKFLSYARPLVGKLPEIGKLKR